jgi:hypothetical protein
VGIHQHRGIDLTLKPSAAMDEVRLFDVILASGVGGLAAWVVNALLRVNKVRCWPSVGTSALVISIIVGPSRLADGASAAALILIHVCVGLVLIAGFAWASASERRRVASVRV